MNDIPGRVVRRHLPLCILLSFLWLSESLGQLNPANLTQYTERDGLPGLQVNHIIKDRLGYLWFGTINGLARYDGYEFKRFYYDPNDPATIHGLSVWSLFEDHGGKIWVSSGPSFLNKYDPDTKTFRQYPFAQLINRPANVEIGISAICEDRKGRFYFGLDTYFGTPMNFDLLYMDEKDSVVRRMKTPDSLSLLNVLKLACDEKGNVWCLDYSGLFRIDTNRRITRVSYLDEESKQHRDQPTDFAFGKDGHLWLVTSRSRIYDLEPETGKFKVYDAGTRNSQIIRYPKRVLALDKNDNIWLGTEDGVSFLDKRTGKYSAFRDAAKKENDGPVVTSLAFDNFGTLWIGTTANGLWKYEDRPQLNSYLYKEGDRQSVTRGWVTSISEAGDGKIWFTTSNSGINALDPASGKVQAYPFGKIAPSLDAAFEIWEHQPGMMYFSCFKSLFAFDEKARKVESVKLAGAPDSITITHRLEDSRGTEWLCTLNGLFKKEKGSQAFTRYDLSLQEGGDASSNEVTRAYESPGRGLWILTNNGLFFYSFSTDSIKRHGYDKSKGDIFVTQDINSLLEDNEGIVWVGTWQGGLSRYDSRTAKIKTYTRNDGLPSMSIQGILADDKTGTLWLSTFEGMSRFDRKKEQFVNYSVADGIQGQLFADGSCLRTSRGLLAFGGSNGITIFDPSLVNTASDPPAVFLTELRLFNQPVIPAPGGILKKPIDETQEITLPFNQNNISLDFLAIHYSNPARNRYSYKLENYDNDWREVGSQRTAFYPKLPPGDYVFRVKAANDKGVWNETGASLRIHVSPPWWRTTWAYLAYALALLVLAYVLDRYFRRRILAKEQEKNRARELEQAREIRQAYNRLEETYEALKATQTQLIQAEKMASLGELTAGIAHEIQNPLNFVNNFSEINMELLEELGQELGTGHPNGKLQLLKDIRENEQKINHHGRRADSIVKGMLQHSRVSTGQREMTDINAMADEYLRLSYHGLRAKDKTFNCTIKSSYDPSVGLVHVVPQDIGRVLLNLYNNAFYAVGEKKKEAPGGYEPTVTITTKRTGSWIEMKVEDNGDGIPQKNMDKIFQPFFTTKPTGQGTGLGLSLSYDIIRAHGGDIQVVTREGEGASFIIRIPARENA